MKKSYEVAFTPAGETDQAREFVEFRNIKMALNFAVQEIKKGATKVFVDTYLVDEDQTRDLIDFIQL